jgi:hypothetical protein
MLAVWCPYCAGVAAGGDDLAAHVLPHQLQELVVLAGLDPAASSVLKLLGLLHRRIEERGANRLCLDDLLDVVNFYREIPLAVIMQMQSQAAALEAAAVSEQHIAQLSERQEDSAAEVWLEQSAASSGTSSKLGHAGGSRSAVWGGGNGEDKLAHHIALHRPAAAGPEQQTVE